MFKDSGAKVVLVSSTTADRLDEVASSPKAILIDENDDERSWRNLPCSKGRAAEQPTPDEPAALFYTSGTTGPPKGVPLTHANLMFQLNALIDAQIVGPRTGCCCRCRFIMCIHSSSGC